MRCTVLRSKAVSHKICEKQHQPPLVNYNMPTTRQWEVENSMFRTPLDFFPRLFEVLRAQNSMVRVIEGKIT